MCTSISRVFRHRPHTQFQTVPGTLGRVPGLGAVRAATLLPSGVDAAPALQIQLCFPQG